MLNSRHMCIYRTTLQFTVSDNTLSFGQRTLIWDIFYLNYSIPASIFFNISGAASDRIWLLLGGTRTPACACDYDMQDSTMGNPPRREKEKSMPQVKRT